MMNSTAKGQAFEKRVYSALAAELRNNRLCASPKSAEVFYKKPYHSRDRNANIITDVSIEVFLPGHERATLIWIFECKDYGSSVPVDDLEEFHAKIQQISEGNTKGTLVTTGCLQRSALTFARSKGIGVIRLLPDDQVIHIMEMITPESLASVDWSEVEFALLDPHYQSRQAFFALQDESFFGTWHSALLHRLSSDE